MKVDTQALWRARMFPDRPMKPGAKMSGGDLPDLEKLKKFISKKLKGFISSEGKDRYTVSGEINNKEK